MSEKIEIVDSCQIMQKTMVDFATWLKFLSVGYYYFILLNKDIIF